MKTSRAGEEGGLLTAGSRQVADLCEAPPPPAPKPMATRSRASLDAAAGCGGSFHTGSICACALRTAAFAFAGRHLGSAHVRRVVQDELSKETDTVTPR